MRLFDIAVLVLGALAALTEGGAAPDAERSVRRDVPVRFRPRQTPAAAVNATASANGTAANATMTPVWNTTGITPLTLSDDMQSYYVLMKLGNISFRVALDTGSADLWITSSGCTTNTCKTSPKYPLGYFSGSFGSVNDNQTVFNASFADGTFAAGFVGMENVQVSNLTVPSQAFGMITNSTVSLDDEMSGVLGLGFPRLSAIYDTVANATPFFATLAEQGQLEYPVFGLSLTRNSSGTLAIGAIDGSVVTNVSNIGWSEVVPFASFNNESNAGNVSSYLQWAVQLTGIGVNGSNITPQPTFAQASGNNSVALIDVGTSGIYGPWQDVTRIFALLNDSRLVDSSGQWALPCATSETLSFSIGGQNITLQPTDYLIGAVAGTMGYCLAWPRASGPRSDGIDWQLGTPFLRTVYSVFSYGVDSKEPPMIGFYPLSNTTAPVPPSTVSAYLSSYTLTVATTLPNFLVPTPSLSTPPYIFNTSIPTPLGALASTGLGTSTYSALATAPAGAAGLPTVLPAPSLVTLVLTDSGGAVVTETSAVPTPSVTLGVPGYGAAAAVRAPVALAVGAVLLSAVLGGTMVL